MAKLTFDDLPAEGEPAKPPQGGGKLSFDDVAAASPEEQSAARVAALKGNIVKHLEATRGKPGYADVIRDNLFFGLNRPLNAVAFASGTGLPDQDPKLSWNERRQAFTQAEQDREAAADKETGWGGTAAGIAATVPSAVITGPAKLLKPGVNALWNAGQGFVEGAAKNSDTFTNAITGGAKQAAIAGASTLGLDKAIKWLPGFRGASKSADEAVDAANKGKSPAELKADAQKLYAGLDQSGIAFDNNQATALGAALRQKIKDANYDPAQHGELKNIIATLEAVGGKTGGSAPIPSPNVPGGWGQYTLPVTPGKPLTYTELASLRTQLTDAMRDDTTGRIRRVAGELLGPIDEFVEKTSPAMNLGKADLSKDWPEARRLWKAKSLAEEAGWVADKAERRAASTYSGQNADNATRQNFRGVMDRVTKPGAFNPYKDEMPLLDQIVRGGKIQNVERDVGNWMSGPGGRTVASAIPAIGAVTGAVGGHMDPAMAMATSALGFGTDFATRKMGHGLRNWAADRGQANVDTLLRKITTGSEALPDPNKVIDREDLARLMLGQTIGRSVTGGMF